MIIGGLQKFSLSDFPGVIAAILFTRGCGFRCPYCHNPELVDPARYAPAYPLGMVKKFLRSRKGRLQGVVLTGGEPTQQTDLPEFLTEIKDMGFAVKLDTNGTNPSMLQCLVADRLVDFIAMDVKAPLARYAETVRAPVETGYLLRSVEVILRSGLPHEFRTTFVESLLSVDDILEIARLVKGCQKYVLQRFSNRNVLEADQAQEARGSRERLTEVARVLILAGCAVEVR
jgi:pyruvate formate lyase activating enzyme